VVVPPLGRPEQLFGMGPVRAVDGGAEAEMPTGPWLAGPDGSPAAGALGVLVDDVLGQAMLPGRPSGHWSVTTELTIDLVAPLPLDGRPLTARSRPVALDAAGAMSRGEVRDADGRVVAVAAVWGRYVPGVPDGVLNPPADGAPAERGRSVAELLGARPGPDGVLQTTVKPQVANPAGVMHGGVLSCLCEAVAATALLGSELRTASLHVVFLRGAAGVLRFVPTVVHRGRALAMVRVDVALADGRTCTAATITARSPLGPSV
jgi:uncharacterized protein (TIGR00369 family)